ncbi:hypothetical protein EXIGLDRAFT_744209 [Exidia glandulosa HHB12029]|uniref:Uncharacterized protein n=1 Tax=Exidia glandulosa HHB12029 TaxID=1314781 RepID=A0A165Q2S3_EXIGL|nr:hypothetical protein EXIGLDRAFT_744209 [Exidia glandulosa HHB12029]
MNSRLFSLVLFFLSFGLFTSASPVNGTAGIEARDAEKRAVAVMSIVGNIPTQVATVMSTFGPTNADSHILAISDVFTQAATALRTTGPVILSTADKNTVAKNVASAINSAATQMAKVPQTAAVISASVRLDAQIKIFLDLLSIIVIGIIPLLAKLIIDIHILLSIHLVVVANIFIDLLGIIIIL